MAYINGKHNLLKVEYKGMSSVAGVQYFDMNVRGGSFPTLELQGISNYSVFSEGQIIVGIPNNDVVFSGQTWFGNMMAQIQVFKPSTQQWVNTSNMTDITVAAGKELVFYVKYNSQNYAFSNFQLLNYTV